MDLAETMKNIVAKGIQTEMAPPFPGTGYVTEKLYMLLQLYLQNKGWNPSVELLQCFTELKESSILPSAAYLQMMASRIALDNQGRLILRENGKIILPYEHFANAVMLKHMNGPHGLHLGLESTVRAVMESYTIGREYFGMEKEFIIEVVQNCPNPACRYYKNQLELSQKSLHLSAPTYIQESGGLSTDKSPAIEGRSITLGTGLVLRTQQISINDKSNRSVQPQQTHSELNHKQSKPQQQQQQQQQTQQQQSQQQQQQSQQQQQQQQSQPQQPTQQQQQQLHFENQSVDHRFTDFFRSNLENFDGLSSANKDLLALHNGAWTGGDVEKRLSSNSEVGQEKIVRAFAEIMKNMSRMKTYVRPAMCKPYGKQSEALQKTLVDTIQLVQSLRSFLPPPHIAVSSWKNEDKHRKSGIEELCDPVRKIE